MVFWKRNIFLILISLLVGAAIFIWFGRVVGWDHVWQAFEVFKGWQGIVILALTFLIAIIGNWRWYEILKDKQVDISFRKIFDSYLGGYAMMYLFPIIFLSGEIFRIFSLVKEEKIQISKAASSVIIERILEWTINIFVILFGLFFLFSRLNLPIQVLYIFGTVLVFFIGSIGFFYFKALNQKSIVSGLIKKIVHKEIAKSNNILEIENEVLAFFQPGSKTLIKGLILSLLRAGVMLVRVWLLIIFLGGISIDFIISLSILGFSYFSALVPIPTSLGAHEIIQVAAFNAFHLESSMVTAFTMIIRGAEIVISILGLGFLLKKGFSIVEEKFHPVK